MNRIESPLRGSFFIFGLREIRVFAGKMRISLDRAFVRRHVRETDKLFL
ncbi:hypothetical protein [Methanosarcina sp.]